MSCDTENIFTYMTLHDLTKKQTNKTHFVALVSTGRIHNTGHSTHFTYLTSIHYNH